MDLEPDAIREIHYDEGRHKLFITFVGGDAFVYVGVPGEVHRSFLEASSRGGFFQHEIRDCYPYNRLNA